MTPSLDELEAESVATMVKWSGRVVVMLILVGGLPLFVVGGMFCGALQGIVWWLKQVGFVWSDDQPERA